MKKRAKENKSYFSKVNQAFKNTKFDKRFLYTLIFDIIYYSLILALLISLLYPFFNNLLTVIQNSIAQNLQDEQIISAASQAAKLFTKLMILGIAIYSLLYVLLKGTIWRLVVKEKYKFSYYLKLILFNLLFIAGLIILTGLTSFSDIIQIIFALALIHFYFVSLILFSKTNKIFSSIKKGFKKGLKLWLFAIPYAILLIIITAKTIIVDFLAGVIVPNISLIALTENSTLPEMQTFVQQALQSFPKVIPFLIVAVIIMAFFKTYMRIFYVEFIEQLE